MIRKSAFIVILAATALYAAVAQGEDCRTAREVIEKNLEAVGGVERIRALESLVLRGASGSALLPPSEEVTLYLLKPDRLKQVGDFRVVLCDGGRYLYNDGTAESEMTGGTLEGMLYRLGFYHGAFSLLKWEQYFDTAELAGVKDYGLTRQYELRFPGAENGRDLLVYIDAETMLIDRLVYLKSQEGAGLLKVVNQLRDWEEHGGLTVPTRIIFDTIGWEASPSHFVISEFLVNEPVDPAIFETASIDFGTVTVGEGRVQGEIYGEMDGTLLTNVRIEDLAQAGIEQLDWVTFSMGDFSMKMRFLENIQASAAWIKPEEIYVTRYLISGFPRILLLGWNMDLKEKIPCEKGDTFNITLLEKHVEEAGQ